MVRPFLHFRLVILSVLLTALCGALVHRDLLLQAAPGELAILMVCLFLPVIPLLLTPLLMPRWSGQSEF
jgi:hypothetical protein